LEKAVSTITHNLVVPNRIWQEDEKLSREELDSLQLRRLRECVARVADVPFYQEAMGATGVSADSINSLDDLRCLPITTKEDLRQHYPLGFLAVPRKELARFHGSSGTTGKPTFVAYTKNDLKTWANLCSRFLVGGGLLPEHTVHVAFGYGLFTGGFGLHYGIENVGAAIIPVSAGNTERQIMIMRDLDAEVLICTPSYALNIAEVARGMGLSAADLPIKYAHFGGEPWTEDMRGKIEEELGILAFDNYGLSEIIGPGVSGECAARCGMHISEDHFLVECLDPDTLEPVAEGEPGELAITTLTKEAMPLLRYRTRDMARLDHSPCVCGRTGVRMSKVIGRSDDMLIIRGANVFPSQIEEALLRVEGTAPHYLIEIDRPGTLDEVSVQVEVRSSDLSDEMRQMQALREKIAKEIMSIAGVRVTVELKSPKTIERSMGKAKRVIDHRREKGLI
jgi:phenylacetate-CoA ligase